MIRKTLPATKAATYCINLPESTMDGLPCPVGTGFFVSAEGLFLTARDVIADQAGQVREDLGGGWLTKELRGGDPADAIYYHPFELVYEDAVNDFAVLRVDFAEQKTLRAWLENESGFRWIKTSRRPLDEGEPVYSFGYPLSWAVPNKAPDGTLVGGATTLHPRVTSAIVSSTEEASGIVTVTGAPATYVLDKALNYGNSGGPIIAEETGLVHAICTRFQPVRIPQRHLEDASGNVPFVMIPSLYGVVSWLADPALLGFLEGEGAEVSDQ